MDKYILAISIETQRNFSHFSLQYFACKQNDADKRNISYYGMSQKKQRVNLLTEIRNGTILTMQTLITNCSMQQHPYKRATAVS